MPLVVLRAEQRFVRNWKLFVTADIEVLKNIHLEIKVHWGELRQDLIPESLFLVWPFAEAPAAKSSLAAFPKTCSCALRRGKKRSEGR